MWRVLSVFRRRPMWEKLTGLERGIINCYLAHVQPTVRERLSSQLGLPGRLVREDGGKTVLFCADIPASLQFADKSSELLLARIWVNSPETPNDIVSHLWLGNGQILSLELSLPAMRGDHPERAAFRCDLFYDPTMSTPKPEPIDRNRLRQVASVLPDGKLDCVLSAVARDRQAVFRRAWGNAVPADYLALCELTDGFLLEGWQFLGTRVRTVPLASCATLLVLAEGPEAQYLCTCLDQAGPLHVYHFDHDCDEPVGSFRSFCAALAEVVAK